jgi:iron complex transport system permease protein
MLLCGGLIVALAATVLLSLGTGAVKISAREILGVLWNQSQSSEISAEIILRIRLPRIVLAALVGCALALSGTVYQGLFRNPMADPYVIGASAGASLGATVAMVLPAGSHLLGLSTIPLFAFAGSLATVLLVFNLARTAQRTPVINLILAGVAVSSVLSAVVSLLMFLMPQEGLHGLVFWLMGGFSGRSWNHVVAIAPHCAVGLVVVVAHARQLNAFLLGEEEAMSLGVDVQKTTRRLVAAASLLTAASVAAGGIIAFAGLVVPHLVRLIVGPDHRRLIPNACLLGAVFMLLADTLARSVIPPRELPVGIITSLTGGPFFIHLLRRHRPREW